eukprot:8925355-Pyramimonas_sp.AAC.1
MSTREAEKRKKYEDTLERVRRDGWEPVLYTLVLGTLGEIYLLRQLWFWKSWVFVGQSWISFWRRTSI